MSIFIASCFDIYPLFFDVAGYLPVKKERPLKVRKGLEKGLTLKGVDRNEGL